MSCQDPYLFSNQWPATTYKKKTKLNRMEEKVSTCKSRRVSLMRMQSMQRVLLPWWNDKKRSDSWVDGSSWFVRATSRDEMRKLKLMDRTDLPRSAVVSGAVCRAAKHFSRVSDVSFVAVARGHLNLQIPCEQAVRVSKSSKRKKERRVIDDRLLGCSLSPKGEPLSIKKPSKTQQNEAVLKLNGKFNVKRN